MLAMTPRLLSMMRYVDDCGEVPLHVFMMRFWPDEHPEVAEHKAKRCIKKYVGQGLLLRSLPKGQSTTVRLSHRAKQLVGDRGGAGIVATGHPRARAHHAATLAYVERVRAELGNHQEIAEVLLEPQLRARLQKGRGTRRGQVYESFPDALLTLNEMMPDGTMTTRQIAVEYVTSKYTSKDILEKSASFYSNYQSVLWVADNPRTQARVARLVGESCACL